MQTSAKVVYLDTSALVKLVSSEAESEALIAFLIGRPTLVSSELAVVELVRAARRQGQETVIRAEFVLSRLHLVSLTRYLLESAGRLLPAKLRSLDAIHLAAALELDGELEALVTYDDRMALGALHHSMAVASPGRG